MRRRQGDTEVAKGRRRGDSPPRGALYESHLQEVGLDDLFDGVLLFTDTRSQGVEACRAAAEFNDQGIEVKAIEVIETRSVNFELGEGVVGELGVDLGVVANDSVISNPVK